MDKRIIELAILALQTKQVSAWVDHYDAGEDGKFNLTLQTKFMQANCYETFCRIQEKVQLSKLTSIFAKILNLNVIFILK